jgi:uncharacterized protein (DUF362 family)
MPASATPYPPATLPVTAGAVSPTYTPVPATLTQPPPATATPLPALDRGTLMAHWPATPTSRVVLVRHSGVWAGEAPDPAVVLQMLDEGLRTLAGMPDALAVWSTLFDPGERVLLKVNSITDGGPTHPAVTYAIVQRLQDAGLAAENLLIFDRADGHLKAAGYHLNDGGHGVQCHGSRGKGSKAALSQATVRFFKELDEYDALINLPIPKQHSTAGISVSLKNHYGSVDNPSALHGNRCDPAIAELNAQPTIQTKTRLVVGAALTLSPGDWSRPERDNVILLSFDPVALDTVARDLLVQHHQAQGGNTGILIEGAPQLRTAQSLGLGATEANLIELLEVTLE